MGVLPAWLLVHQVLVEPAEGEGPFGPEYGDAVTVRCFVDEKRRLVRDAEGSEVVSETTVYMPLDTACPTGSRVTANGRTTTVITSSRRDGGGLPVPDHLEVALQ
ncbi:hypothetical protein [Streptosporangium minutum]|uniref:Head-to-tail stopper n=1 Tax=Streptosporangium minutum TaxID=569862 RepID=A0A243RWD7_9ACTN|nr:hypothetical protein [Streptosporangium minutum]OUC99319.1 hypothetical protein CA984_03680 [Streptosporangium minutum]